MRLLELLRKIQHHYARLRRRNPLDVSIALDRTEQPLTVGGEAFVVDRAGGRDKDAARAITVAHERHQRLAVDRVDGLDRAENRQRERMALPEMKIEEVVDKVVGSVFRLRDFLQHHLALAIDLLGIENRFEEYVSEQF